MLIDLKMLAHCLERVGLPEHISPLHCHEIAPDEIVHLLQRHLHLRALCENASRTDIVEIIEKLAFVLLDFAIGLYVFYGFDGGLFEAHIIIIG